MTTESSSLQTCETTSNNGIQSTEASEEEEETTTQQEQQPTAGFAPTNESVTANSQVPSTTQTAVQTTLAVPVLQTQTLDDFSCPAGSMMINIGIGLNRRRIKKVTCVKIESDITSMENQFSLITCLCPCSRSIIVVCPNSYTGVVRSFSEINLLLVGFSGYASQCTEISGCWMIDKDSTRQIDVSTQDAVGDVSYWLTCSTGVSDKSLWVVDHLEYYDGIRIKYVFCVEIKWAC